MEETALGLKIIRPQSEALKTQLEESQIVWLQGPKGIGSLDLLKESLEELNATSCLFEKKHYSSLPDNCSAYLPELKKLSGNKNRIVLSDAEFFPSIQNLLEETLVAENAPQIIVLASYKIEIDELLFEALKQSGSVIELFPISFHEFAQTQGMGAIEKSLESRLIYGAYPDVIDQPEKADEILQQKIEEMLKTQISFTQRINKKEQLIRVLKVLAFEMGNLISYNDIAIQCDLDNETVMRYVELFENAFILKRISSYYSGKKYEMKKGVSVYFIDNGIRNALINNFNSMDWRNDATALWRNWLMIEKMKWNASINRKAEYFTWQSHTKQHVDILEVCGSEMMAYQTSWTKKKKSKFPAGFTKNYPDATTFSLNRSTYWSFLTKKK
ncbi:MAG: putative AAA+ superfamily ATPase [Lentimonas sp.]|jgi:predicted AAA+ superfamily ATPase